MTKWICLSTSEIAIYVYEIIIDICEITCYYYHVIQIHEILTKTKQKRKIIILIYYINFKITITKKEKRRKGEQGNEQWIFQNRHAEE